MTPQLGTAPKQLLLVRVDPVSSQLSVGVVELNRRMLDDALPRAHVLRRIPLGRVDPEIVAREVVLSLKPPAGPPPLPVVPEDVLESRQLTSADGRRADLMAQAQLFIDRNLSDQRLSPEMVARAIHVSRRYLHVIFQPSGVSVSQYVRRRRLEVSLRLLAEEHLARVPIADIAVQVGFRDPSHFARLFKSTFGVTPREYRTAGSLPHAAAGPSSSW